MSEGFRTGVDYFLKILAMLIALFGVWKYFADKDAAVDAAAKAKSISYIHSYASGNMRDAREVLFSFWVSQDAFIDHVRSNKITHRDYENFVRFVLPRYENPKALQGALFSLANLYDQIIHCRESAICDAAILDDYFCPIVVQQQAQYGPFYEVLRADVASKDFGKSLERYAGFCGDRGRPDASGG